jgi:type III pantothenate kinase
MTFLVDIGNTRVKWAYARGEGLQPGGSATHRDDGCEALFAAWARLPAPTTVHAVSVASEELNARISYWVKTHWGLEVAFLRSTLLGAGVVNGYHEPARLGADRWAAIIGARARQPLGGAIVVDSGSAVTVDAVGSDGKHRGGVIFPGISLMRRALQQGAAQLPLIEVQEATAFARDTACAIASGTLLSVAYAIQGLASEMAAGMGEVPTYWLTGGDAPVLLPFLHDRFEHAPNLVLEGLAAAVGELP